MTACKTFHNVVKRKWKSSTVVTRGRFSLRQTYQILKNKWSMWATSVNSLPISYEWCVSRRSADVTECQCTAGNVGDWEIFYQFVAFSKCLKKKKPGRSISIRFSHHFLTKKTGFRIQENSKKKLVKTWKNEMNQNERRPQKAVFAELRVEIKRTVFSAAQTGTSLLLLWLVLSCFAALSWFTQIQFLLHFFVPRTHIQAESGARTPGVQARVAALGPQEHCWPPPTNKSSSSLAGLLCHLLRTNVFRRVPFRLREPSADLHRQGPPSRLSVRSAPYICHLLV